MMEDIIRGMAGYDEICSESEFKGQLKQVDLLYKEFYSGWVFWRAPERCQQFDSLISSTNYYISKRQIIKDKIKHVLEEFASLACNRPYLVQFWAPEVQVEQQHFYLTTSDQPFAVGECLYKGYSWYRERCMGHRYRADDGAHEEELGAVGRVYRNKRPESTPDLRLYSSNEFPLPIRAYAAACGLRSYYALPVFDLLKEICYGVIEALCFVHIEMDKLFSLIQGLEAADLRTTHLNRSPRAVDIEITKMLQLATMTLPQLQMAQVWVPCHECSNTGNNLSCMERATYITAGDGIGGSISGTDDYDMQRYLEACQLHNLQIGEDTNTTARTAISSNNKPCICRNICDFSIFENPLAHYAQKARLSFCFAICLRSFCNSRDIYLVEFFLPFNSREDAFIGSFLPLLLRIMETELKSFEFAYKGHRGEELVVEVLKENMLSSGESSQSNALRYESVKYKHQNLEDVTMSMVMKEFEHMYALSDIMKSSQKPEISENEVNSNSSLMFDTIQEKIKRLMSKITSKCHCDFYALAQFWAPKMDMDRCYLETSGQPFASGSFYKGLAYFRKHCMEHHYFVDDGAKEDELGPPGRVFLNGCPEFSPDLHLYSPTEFPLKNHAAYCCLRQYFALPVFDLNQRKCVGVLELVGRYYPREWIEDALEAANLSSTFKPSFQRSHLSGNDDECRQLALTEIKKACKLFKEIPQLYMVEVWVPYSECSSINNNLSCMEGVRATKDDRKFDQRMPKIQHVETRKGIAGMALASENKSCFFRNLCGFGIADEPLAHYKQQARLDVCFAICLQSQYTGNPLYVLEFYLNQGPGKYEYLRSFLCFLLPIMKQKLRSFKVASGQQLGEKLVVEVIEFSEVNELDFSELDQPDVDGLPIIFKFVNYGGQKHCKDKQVQLAPEVMESVRIVAEAQHCSNSAANLKKKDAAKGTKEGKRETGLNITFKDLESHFGQKSKDAAKSLGVSESTLKRICRKHGIQRWPQNGKYKETPSLFMRESANESAQQNMGQSSCSNLPAPAPHMPPHQNVPHTNPESSPGLIVQSKVDMVVIKAKYKDDTIRIELCRSAGLEKLMNEVGRRLNLTVGSFQLKYFDEDNDEILLAVDDDLQLCLKNPALMGKPYIQVFVQSI